MKVVQYDTLRIVREWDPQEQDPSFDPFSITAAGDIVKVVCDQEDEERWLSIVDHVADHAPTSFVTTVLVYDDEGKVLSRGSLKSTPEGRKAQNDDLDPLEIRDGE